MSFVRVISDSYLPLQKYVHRTYDRRLFNRLTLLQLLQKPRKGPLGDLADSASFLPRQRDQAMFKHLKLNTISPRFRTPSKMTKTCFCLRSRLVNISSHRWTTHHHAYIDAAKITCFFSLLSHRPIEGLRFGDF